ncbi:MAG TPA: alpha/beta fold hydrolase [Gammaproteobacteria bacterium]
MNPSGGEVEIRAGGAVLHGDLHVPEAAGGIVIFAHGSGSSRFSPRNRSVARRLQERRLGTLLFDLLTADEERADMATGRYRFDIAFLAPRLAAVAQWLEDRQPGTALGYFGASTGAAAALVAAAEAPQTIRAVVSRGGRPDLAADALERVRAPTLLIVGGEDHHVMRLNERALARLRCEKKLVVVPGATHLFEEPGALDEIARHAAEWFTAHFPQVRRTG